MYPEPIIGGTEQPLTFVEVVIGWSVVIVVAALVVWFLLCLIARRINKGDGEFLKRGSSSRTTAFLALPLAFAGDASGLDWYGLLPVALAIGVLVVTWLRVTKHQKRGINKGDEWGMHAFVPLPLPLAVLGSYWLGEKEWEALLPVLRSWMPILFLLGIGLVVAFFFTRPFQGRKSRGQEQRLPFS